MQLVKVVKVCLNEIYSKGCIGELLSPMFPVQSDVKEGDKDS
jgi:hypothetical protein